MLIGDLIEHCQCACFQIESAPSTGYIHFQGYFELTIKKRYSWIQNNIRHFEYLMPRKGTSAQAWAYSSKQETRLFGPYQFGCPAPVEDKIKLEAMVNLAITGASPLELFQLSPALYTRNVRNIEAVCSRVCVPKGFRPEQEVILIYGEPGTGKTRLFSEQFPNHYRIPVSKDLWWDNYRGDKQVLIDDFSGNLQLKDLLQILDKYSIQVPTKGSFTWFYPEIIGITTNVHPLDWYQYQHRTHSFKALTRRFTSIYHFTGNNQFTSYHDPLDLDYFFNHYPTDSLPPIPTVRNLTLEDLDARGYVYSLHSSIDNDGVTDS